MKILELEEEFCLSVETFFTFFFESTNFKQKYHTSRGDRDIEIKQWAPTSDGRYTREVNFCSAISNSPVINKIVGDKAKVKEVQYYKLSDGKLNVIAETYFDGSIGKSFQSVSEWNVYPINEPQPGCKVVIKVKNNYSGTMFKSILENWVHSTTEESFKKWLDLVRQQVEEYEKNEQLKRVTPTPVKQQQQQQQQQRGDDNNNNRNTPIPFEMVDENQQQVQHRANKLSTTTTTTTSTNNNNNSNISKTTPAISSPVSNKITLSPPLNHHDDDSITLVEEQHTTTTFSYHNSHQHHHNNKDIDSDNESDLSDISHVPPSHLGDFTDDEEYNSNEEFYDTNDVWQQQSSSSESQKRDIKNFMQTINNDLTNIKSIIEVNHNRLLGLEDSFQSSRNLVGGAIVSNNNTQQNRHQQSTLTATNNNVTAGGNVNSDLTTTYLNRLEDMVKNLQEDEIKSREKQKEWEQKIVDLEKKINSLGSSQSKYIMWLNIGALIFFLIGWPIAAKKLWKYLLPLFTSALKK